jgi:heme/copper-type cytochrome/quinol oxidase subunit 4
MLTCKISRKCLVLFIYRTPLSAKYKISYFTVMEGHRYLCFLNAIRILISILLITQMNFNLFLYLFLNYGIKKDSLWKNLCSFFTVDCIVYVFLEKSLSAHFHHYMSAPFFCQ